MRYSEIHTNQSKLDSLFASADKLPADPEIRSHWAKYLCVLASGFLETSIAAIYVRYAQNKAHPHIVNWLTSELEFFINPNMSKVLELTGRFNVSWAAELERNTQGSIKDAIDSIYANRNPIAHGESVELTMARMSQYYVQAKKLIRMIDELSQ